MPEFRDTVSFKKVTVEAETGRALLCVCPDWDEPVWIAKSQISDDSEVFSMKTSGGELIISQWLADQKDL